MERVRGLVEKELALLRELVSADVSAVAWKRREDGGWSWWAAAGCGDDRHRQLAVRMGRGPEGRAPRIGRPVVVDDAHRELSAVREESPLMVVERLQAAIAYPIVGSAGVDGVLLAGNRDARAYTHDNLLVMQLSSRWLGQLRDYAENGAPVPADARHGIME